MSTCCVSKIDSLIAHFGSPAEKLSVWLPGCFSDYPLQSIRNIRNLISDAYIHIASFQSLIDGHIIPQIIQLLQQNNYTFEMLLSGYIRESTLEYMVPKDIMTTIHSLCIMRSIDDPLQLEGRAIIAAIASKSWQQTTCIVDNGAIPILMGGISKHQSILVQTVSIRALSNIIANDSKQRDSLFKDGIVKQIIKLMRHHKMSKRMKEYDKSELTKMIAYATLTVSKQKPIPKWKYTKKLLSIISVLLKSRNNTILQSACRALGYLTNSKRNCSRLYIFFTNHTIVLAKLVQLLDHDWDGIRHAALVTIGVLCTGTYQHTHNIIKYGALKKLAFILHHDVHCIKRVKLACSLISTVIRDSKKRVKAVLRANLMPELLNVLNNKRQEIAVAALCTLSNATNTLNETEIDYIVERGGMQSVCKFLIYPQMNGVLMKALVITENMLIRKEHTDHFEACGGLESVKSLRSNQNVSKKIYHKIDSIIRLFCRLQCDS